MFCYVSDKVRSVFCVLDIIKITLLSDEYLFVQCMTYDFVIVNITANKHTTTPLESIPSGKVAT